MTLFYIIFAVYVLAVIANMVIVYNGLKKDLRLFAFTMSNFNNPNFFYGGVSAGLAIFLILAAPHATTTAIIFTAALAAANIFAVLKNLNTLKKVS